MSNDRYKKRVNDYFPLQTSFTLMANCNPPSTNSNYVIKEKIILLYRQRGWCHHKFPEVSLHPSVLLNDITIIPSLNILQFTQQFRIADRDDFIIDGFLSLNYLDIEINMWKPPKTPHSWPRQQGIVYQRNCGINDIQNVTILSNVGDCAPCDPSCGVTVPQPPQWKTKKKNTY